MKLVFNGHRFKYETESLCKLFFGLDRFELAYDVLCFDDDEYIFTRICKGKMLTYCYAIIKYNGVTSKKLFSLPNTACSYDKECEIKLCSALFIALKRITGITPPWGILTGIRPVKRIQNYLSEGKTQKEITELLKNKFYVSDNKIRLGLDTALNQRRLLEDTDYKHVSLYVAIPFCPSRCSYCSFISQSAADKNIYKMIPSYLEYLFKELMQTANIINSLGLKLKTVYIGGGTPTVLSAQQLNSLMCEIEKLFDLSYLCEYTVEAGRPDSITEDKLMAIKSNGASRISINPQTLNDDVLRINGRKHTVKQFYDCFDLAESIGFKDINTDLIAGLTGDDYQSFCRSVDGVIELSPSNITVHTLSYKKAARLYAAGKNQNASERIGDMVDYAGKRLYDSGYLPYYLYRQKNTLDNLENVGYSRRGNECIYNIYIMEETHTIIAVGASASTKLVNPETGLIERVFNYKYPFEYIKGFDVITQRKNEVISFYEREFGIEK